MEMSRLQIGFLAALILAATAAHGAPEPQKLRLFLTTEKSTLFNQAMRDLADKFTKEKGVAVELVQRTDTFENLRGIVSSRLAGDVPDIAMVQESDIPTLLQMQVMAGLPESWYASKKILKNLEYGARCGDGPCSIPFQRRLPVWLFNKEVLFRLNLDHDHIPVSLVELAKLSALIREKTGLSGLSFGVNGQNSLFRWSMLGLRPMKDPVHATLDFVSRLWDRRGNIQTDLDSGEDLMKTFMDQKTAIYSGGLGQWYFLRNGAKFKWGAELPALPEGEDSYSWSGTDLVLLSVKNRDKALELLDFLYRSDNVAFMMRAAPNLPVSSIYLKDATWKKEANQIPPLKTYLARGYLQKSRSANLQLIPPQNRREWAVKTWRAVELHPAKETRPDVLRQLETTLQKLLSTPKR